MNDRPGLVLELQAARRRLRELETKTVAQAADIKSRDERLNRYAHAIGTRSLEHPDRYHFTIIFDRNHAKICKSPNDYLGMLLEEMRQTILREIQNPNR